MTSGQILSGFTVHLTSKSASLFGQKKEVDTEIKILSYRMVTEGILQSRKNVVGVQKFTMFNSLSQTSCPVRL